MKRYDLKFSGALIERGFWLYIWRITHGKDLVLYVGRTGDSSSRHAASPFSRMGQHLDLRPNAKGNTLLKNIKAEGFDPTQCEFEMVSIGPLYPEQTTLEKHREYRDKVAPLEAALAQHLRDLGHRVIGTHPKPKPVDEKLFGQIVARLEDRF